MNTCPVCTLTYPGNHCPNATRAGKDRDPALHAAARTHIERHRAGTAAVQAERETSNMAAPVGEVIEAKFYPQSRMWWEDTPYSDKPGYWDPWMNMGPSFDTAEEAHEWATTSLARDSDNEAARDEPHIPVEVRITKTTTEVVALVTL